MTLAIEAEAPPLRRDEDGAVRVGNTRVLYVLVVRAYQGGATPEDIVRMYRTLDLSDVYGAIAYYLRHRREVEEHLDEYDRRAAEVRRKIEERQGPQTGIRDRLLRRLAGDHSSAGGTAPGNPSVESAGAGSPAAGQDAVNGIPGDPTSQPPDGSSHGHGQTSGR
jgi:uncharacterized protein (DUF433 family)